MGYSVDPNRVSHERLQDEVIIINMVSGAYYSGSGSAADVWTLISSGASIENAAAVLAAAYSSDEALVLKDVQACVSFLLDRKIIDETPESDNGVSHLVEAATVPWTAPVFDEYTDMWDLILLDPIHDVGEAGWPYVQPPKA